MSKEGSGGRDRSSVLVAAIRSASGQTCTVAELQARLGPELGPTSVNALLEQLVAASTIVLVDHSVSDPHLADLDLRTVSAVADSTPEGRAEARQRAEQGCDQLLRQVLASHRCG